MFMTLTLKKPCEFFWLRKIHGIDISQCCIKCFPGESFKEVYHKSRTSPCKIAFLVPQELSLIKPLAYYLCGLSRGFDWNRNTHVAFNPSAGDTVEADTEEMHVVITDAKQIRFADYKPDPPGSYTNKQRKCRNWIFANYIKDGQPL